MANDNKECRNHINQQAEVALLILAPILIAFLVFINWAVILLYSSKFLAITDMVYWATLGIFFKAMSWAIAFVFLAKGASRLFFWNELAGSIHGLGLSILGYHLAGLTGLGVSFFVSYLLYLIQVYIVARKKYRFSFYSSMFMIFCIQFLLALTCFAVVIFIREPYAYLPGILLIAISVWISYNELEKRIGLRELVQNRIDRIKKK